MSDELYYEAYEKRYRIAHGAGIDFWGHTPDDEVLLSYLKEWVTDNDLVGKRVIEFACGEGAAGLILSKLGCIYHGVDISPAAVEKARDTLKGCENATISQLDMVRDKVDGMYDAALDSMGFHMIVLDPDRQVYLSNVFNCLRDGSPMLFFRESYRSDINHGYVETMKQWLELTGDDYNTPFQRIGKHGDEEIEVYVPLVPARGKNKADYINELTTAGFIVDEFIEMPDSKAIPYSATIKVHKQ